MNVYENARRVHDTIAANTNRMTAPILVSLLKTHVLPFLVFVAALLASGYARIYVDVTFMNSSLNLLTGISTTLVTLVLTWWALRWSEIRFNGWTNVRRMFRVVSSMARLETALKEAESATPVDAGTLQESAENAWSAYELLAQGLGMAV